MRSQEEENEQMGMYDEDEHRLFKNTDSNGRFHSDWCSMMYSRLMLARNLLKDDGVIFISIDDSEVENLRKIADELFGEINFIADLIWQKKFSRSNDATYFSTMHDHILCYCKKNILVDNQGWKIGLLPRGDEIPSGYGNPDHDPRGAWTSVILSAKSGSSSLLYEITTPSGRKVTPPSGRYWSCSKDTFDKWVADNRIWFGANGDGTPRKKTFLSEVQAGLRPNTILFQDEVGNNQEAKQETKALFDGIGVFDGPKPVRLLKLLEMVANFSSNIQHITYNMLDERYDTDIFTEPTLKGKLGTNAMKAQRHLYDHIVYDSINERDFAADLDTNTDVAVYVKLPDSFYISTPVGRYNPDWAIAFYDGNVKHNYFVAETKGSMRSMQLRLIEESKIHCAREHFKAISNGNVVYDVVDSYAALLTKIMK